MYADGQVVVQKRAGGHVPFGAWQSSPSCIAHQMWTEQPLPHFYRVGWLFDALPQAGHSEQLYEFVSVRPVCVSFYSSAPSPLA